ncbi:hypothetical protein JOF53_004931 [Crossiella equi]|uniref:Tetratricopeptide repeat protein n=1 Tax=Crossiella equi TaxID=130796 RepID=A0ABS5AHK3_9PSEU|nr:hypothetical protein [Crossiella equi]MBP2476059.1 hypothetical protein [Crossiella equi]
MTASDNERMRAIVAAKWRLSGTGSSPAEEQVRRADELAVAGDYEGALSGYRAALAEDRACRPAALGEVVGLLATGQVVAATALAEALLAGAPQDPVLGHHLGLALYAETLAVRARKHDGTPVLLTSAQARTCGGLADRILALAGDDRELRTAAEQLRADVDRALSWAWTERTPVLPAVAGLLVAALLLVTGVLAGDLTPVVLGGVLGALTLFLHVVLHRRPRVELRARLHLPLVAHPGR